jgi:hypothetical protein
MRAASYPAHDHAQAPLKFGPRAARKASKPPTRVRLSSFSATFVAIPGVDGLRSFRALLKVALRHFGLRAIDVREIHHQLGNMTMSKFSERIRDQKNQGLYKVADLEGGKEVTHTIAFLDEQVEMFGKTVDILNFSDTARQLQLNLTTAEFLLDTFGDEPKDWAGKAVTLFLAEYEFKGERKQGIRLKKPGAEAAELSAKRALARKADSGKPAFNDDVPFNQGGESERAA